MRARPSRGSTSEHNVSFLFQQQQLTMIVAANVKTYEKEEEEERVMRSVDSSTDPPTFDWVEFSSSEGPLHAPQYSKFNFNARRGWFMNGVDDDDDWRAG